MCGIAGFVGEGDRDTLARMIGTLKHRGPDDSGIWQDGPVGFAHARLSIIDLSPLGHQPMQSADQRVNIVFNGEIYNHKELREKLELQRRTFHSKSDTEVIIQMYEAFGERAFAELEGMFAFALYDSKNKSLFLARDRMGEKPLYFTLTQGTLVFASEPKALFKHDLVHKRIDPEGVASYLTFDAVLTPQGIFKDIHKLEAASYAIYRERTWTVKTYWTPPQETETTMSHANALKRLDTALRAGVSKQMVADVPVGVFLSGGLDSSIIAWYAAQEKQRPIHTFSIGFEDPSYDESTHAREAARAIGTEHHEHIVRAEEMVDTLRDVIANLDEPIADPAMLPTYLLARFAREHVTVALGGEGSDELFGGYQTFGAERWARAFNALPYALQAGVKMLADMLPVSHGYFSFDFKVRQFLRGTGMDEKYMHQAWLESFNADERAAVLDPAHHRALKDPYQRIDQYLAQMPHADSHLQTAYFYLRTYLLDVLLVKADRMSMFHSLEVRAPFLDIGVAEFALRMPWPYKHRGMTGKYILRELMSDRLPASIVKRKKHGFGLPIGQWLQDEWRELLTDTLSERSIRSAGICEPHCVSRLVEEHLSGARNHRKKLFSLLMLHLWHERWIRV